MAETQPRPSAHRQHPWRWMVLSSRFLWSFIALGNFKSMGVFLPHFVDNFSTSTAFAGLLASATLGVGLVVGGPFVGAMVTIWDSRKLTMVGGVVTGIATIAGSFATSLTQLGVLFAISSIGLTFVQVAINQSLMDYFPDDFAFANGVSLAGGTIGMMVLPPLVDYLVFLYGWRSALALTGALSFNYVVCGALLRPLISRHGARYSRVPSQIDEENKSQTSSGLPGEKTDSTERKSVLGRVSEALRERFDAETLTEPTFIVFQVMMVLEGMIFSMWHLFLIPQGIELGFGDSPSAFLATFGGIGSLIGRLSHGKLVDLGLVKASTMFILACFVFAVPNLLDPLAVSSYTAMATIAAITGTAIGVIYPLTFVLMREMIGDRRMSAYGWLFVSHGGGQLLGGAFAGWVHDISEAYEIVFMTTGAVAVTMAAILGLMRCLVHFRTKA